MWILVQTMILRMLLFINQTHRRLMIAKGQAILSNRYSLDGYQLYVKKTNGQAMTFLGDDSNYVAVGTGAVHSMVDAQIVSATFDRSNEAINKIYLNGVKKGETSLSSVGDSSMKNGQVLEIGHEFNNRYTSKYFYQGDIAEILIFSKVLDSNEMAELNSYLSNKWGLNSIVDSDNDGFIDAVEIANGSLVTDASSKPANIPTVITDAKLWFDAKNINGSGNAGLNTGDAILEWKDLSGNNIHVTQTTAASQPTLTSDGINFDLGEHLINSDLDYGLLTTAATLFVVVNPDINNGSIIDQGFYHGGVERGWNLHRGRDWWAGSAVASNSVVWNSHHTSTGVNANHSMYAKSADGQTPNNQTQIITVKKNSNVLTFIGDGAPMTMADDTIYTGDINYTSGYQLMLGRTNAHYLGASSGNKDPYDGEMMEIIVFDTVLSDEDIWAVQAYLSQKWNLTSTVDSDNDGFTDAAEIAAGSDPVDATSLAISYPDLSDTVDAEIGVSSDLDGIENNLALWLDAANINGTNNVGLTDNQGIDTWFDMSGKGHHLSQSRCNEATIVK